MLLTLKRLYASRLVPSAKPPTRFALLLPVAIALILLILCVHTVFHHHPTTPPITQCVWPPPVRVFLHLHKTAGNNLKVSLAGFARRNGLKLWHTCHPAERDTMLEHLYFRRTPKPANATDCNLKPFARRAASERVSMDFISGHQYLGAHSLLIPRTSAYFTFLRHPLRRKVSHYAHFELSPQLRAANATLHTLTELLLAERPRLARYLLHENRNYMTKRLAAGAYSSELLTDIRSRLVDNNLLFARSALRSAQSNLQSRFFFVGLQERYAESLCVLAQKMNSGCFLSLGRHGRLQKRLRFNKIATSTINQREISSLILSSIPNNLARHTLMAENLDLRLYNFAVSLFEKQLKHHPQCRGV